MLRLQCHFNHFDFRVTGDGSCLFYVASKSIYGEESKGLILRILTSIEVFNNADYYASHPHLTATKEQGYFCKDNSPFTITVSDNALTKFCPKTNNKEDCIKQEAIIMCALKEYAAFFGWCNGFIFSTGKENFFILSRSWTA